MKNSSQYYENLNRIKKNMGDDLSICQKYNRGGIYCWKINGKIVYIGKSENMLHRIASHINHMEIKEAKDSYENKYEIMRQARAKQDITVGFDVLCYCGNQELKQKEAYYINKYLPVLNTQIPSLINGKKGKYNPKAQTITLQEVLEAPVICKDVQLVNYDFGEGLI